MDFINSVDQLFQAELYCGNDIEWVELRSLATKPGESLTVQTAAKYLISDTSLASKLSSKVRDLEQKFNFSLYFVDACPKESGAGLYLRNGNKRSIAYAMRIIKEADTFRPITIRDWQERFTIYDLENLNNLPTTDDPVV